MEWYEAILGKLIPDRLYSHKEIINMLSQEKPGLGQSGYHWAIDKLIQKGKLDKKGYGIYSIPDGKIRRVYSPSYSEEAHLLIKVLCEKYPFVAFTVFETVLMNNFLSHLIGQNTIFLQVEKESSIYVFRYLQEEGVHKLLYKPDKTEFSLYWEPGTVVITDLISEAPMKSNDPHSIMLEKMLVDMCADKIIASTFSRAELPDVFDQAMNRYMLDTKRLFRYARRRHKADEIRRIIEGDK